MVIIASRSDGVLHSNEGQSQAQAHPCRQRHEQEHIALHGRIVCGARDWREYADQDYTDCQSIDEVARSLIRSITGSHELHAELT
jgi:hypothetical protein